MATMTTTHLVLVPRLTERRGAVLLMRAGRRLADKWNAALSMTPQKRADAYVARMPIAVLGD